MILGRYQDSLKHLENKNPYFIDIQSIANAYKHLYLDPTKPHVSIGSTGAIDSMETESISINCNQKKEERIFETYYVTKTGDTKRLLEALESIQEMWNQIV